MPQISAAKSQKLRNTYDSDLAIIPEVVDSALAHFYTTELSKPMTLEIRIVPEIQNRRNVTLVIGDTESINIDGENKYLRPCVCKSEAEKEIQKVRLHMAFDELRKEWNQICSREKSSYRNDPAMYMYTPSIISSTSTAKPIAIRRSTSFCHKSNVNAIRSKNSPTLHRSQSF